MTFLPRFEMFLLVIIKDETHVIVNKNSSYSVMQLG